MKNINRYFKLGLSTLLLSTLQLFTPEPARADFWCDVFGWGCSSPSPAPDPVSVPGEDEGFERGQPPAHVTGPALIDNSGNPLSPGPFAPDNIETNQQPTVIPAPEYIPLPSSESNQNNNTFGADSNQDILCNPTFYPYGHPECKNK